MSTTNSTVIAEQICHLCKQPATAREAIPAYAGGISCYAHEACQAHATRLNDICRSMVIGRSVDGEYAATLPGDEVWRYCETPGEKYRIVDNQTLPAALLDRLASALASQEVR